MKLSLNLKPASFFDSFTQSDKLMLNLKPDLADLGTDSVFLKGEQNNRDGLTFMPCLYHCGWITASAKHCVVCVCEP